jgi:hypothetical protein
LTHFAASIAPMLLVMLQRSKELESKKGRIESFIGLGRISASTLNQDDRIGQQQLRQSLSG